MTTDTALRGSGAAPSVLRHTSARGPRDGAPMILLSIPIAQAIGRLGNWFDQGLFG